MTGRLTALLLLGSGGLGAWLWAERFASPSASDVAIAGAPGPLPAAHDAAARDDAERRQRDAATALGRPVFSVSRRAKGEAAPAAAAPASALPRMTAILIDGQAKSAIFEGDGKPTVVGEGGRLGAFTIQSIEPQRVTVIGPDGRRVVRTSFAAAPGSPPPATAVAAPPASAPAGAAGLFFPGLGGPAPPNLGAPR